MIYQHLKRCRLLVVLFGLSRVCGAQISGVEPGTHCLDEHIDAPAIAALLHLAVSHPGRQDGFLHSFSSEGLVRHRGFFLSPLPA